MKAEGATRRASQSLAQQGHLTVRLLSFERPVESLSSGEGLTLVFLQRGKAKVVWGRLKTHLAAGDSLIVGPSRRAVRLLPGTRDIVARKFTVAFEHLVPLFAAEEISLLSEVTQQLKGFRRHAAASPLAKECFRVLREIASEPGLEHRGQLLHLATVLLTDEFRKARKGRSVKLRPNQRLSERLQGLSSEELLRLPVEALAGKFGCSPRHLNRLFQRHFGASVGALRMETRMLKAASLLRDPHAKVSNVATQCGFGHPSLFNTCFKKRFGACPSEWRKRHL